jgi:lipoprotein-anchoring transpeptidase ErfK/SrfK
LLNFATEPLQILNSLFIILKNKPLLRFYMHFKKTLITLVTLNLLSGCAVLDSYLGNSNTAAPAELPPVYNNQGSLTTTSVDNVQHQANITPTQPPQVKKTLPVPETKTKVSHDRNMPFWGDKASLSAETNPARLKSGQFIWKGDAVPNGPIVVVVSLTEQRAYVYRNGIRIGVSSVSTGKGGYATPTGVFTVLNKDRSHRSKAYNNAPMPFSERLTWDGVALHAGGLPGYPSSHGCVHLPSEFARLLFESSPKGMTVVIASIAKNPEQVAHPAPIAPVNAKTGAAVKNSRLAANEEFHWQPEKSPEGPLSIVMSKADHRVLVFRNGIEIGRSKIKIGKQAIGTHAFIMQNDWGTGESPILQGAKAHRWIAVGIPGHEKENALPLKATVFNNIELPQTFAESLYNILEPGTTLLVTDSPILEQKTTGVPLNILNADKPET